MTADPQPTAAPDAARIPGHDPAPATPRPTSPERRKAEPRTAAERAADHAAIERLADDLLPALAAKLAASGLGEIEVGEDDWNVRVRRPADGAIGAGRRATDKASRSQPGHAGHGHAPGGFEGHRSARDSKATLPPGTAGTASGNGAADPTSQNGHLSDGAASDGHRVIATSPAVGMFQPRSEMKPGSRVRNGDRLGVVDMLGVPQDVVAPADGIVGASLVEPGQAVEYGQELVVIERAARSVDRIDG